MKKYFTYCVLIISLFAFTSKVNSQISQNTKQIASNDSLSGFNYNGAFEHASHMKTDKQKQHFLDHATRTYKISAFDLYNKNIESSISKNSGDNTIQQGPQPAGCTNIDFESGNTTSWTVAGDFQVTSGAGVDPFGGFPVVRPGGTNSLKLNNNNLVGKTNFQASASRVIPVSAINSQFQLHFAFCILNFPHPGNAAALFQVQFFDQFNNLLSCPQFTCYYANPPGAFIGMPPGTAQTSSINGLNIGNQSYPVTYVPWTTIGMDLTPYIGTNVTVRISCNWCIYNYDWGYCYIDADCLTTNTPPSTYCPGTICGPAGMASYTWIPPPGGGSVSTNSCITANLPGTYTCNYTPFTTCGSTTKTVSYIISPPPVAGFTSANTCNTFTFTNTGTAAPAIQTYSFVGPGAPASYSTTSSTSSVTFPSSGTYTVYQTVTTACPATASIVVTVPPAPNPAFTTPTYTQCFTGNSFVFTAANPTGTHTYSFSAGGPPSGNTPTYGPVSFSAPGTYTVTHTINTGGGSCTNITTSVVVINPQPTVTAINNGPICTGGALTLSGGGGTTYAWSGPGGFTSSLANPTITAVTVANAGVYTVTATLLGCTNTTTTNVVVTTPSGSASNTGPYCAGATAQLNTGAATSYNWTGPAGFTSALQNPTLPSSTPAMSGVYSVTLNFGGCTTTATTAVVVNALPSPIANNNSPICTGADLNLTGTGGTTYSWSGPSGYTSSAQNPTITLANSTTAGIYTLTVIDANSCTNTNTTNVVINVTPTITVNNPTVCLNQAIGLTSTGGSSYSWAGPAGFTSTAQNPNIAISTLTMSGLYTVTVTSASGCTNTAVSTVSVYPLPFPSIVSNTPCVGANLNLTGSGATVYAWSGPNGFTSFTQNPIINSASLLANGTYSLLATIGTCSAITSAVITINPLPVPVIISNSPVCIGQSINLSGSGGVSYLWNGPGGFTDATQNPTITVSVLSNAGNYILSVIDVNGCTNSTTQAVIVNPQPIVNANGSIVCENANANLSASGGVLYSWSGPAGYVSVSQNPQIINASLTAAGQYTVIITDANTCTNTAVANIGINPLPTPSMVTNSPICLNNILSLTATGGVSYSWNGPNGFTSSIQNPTVNATSISVGGNYQVLVTDINGCTASTNSNTIINPLPLPSISSGPNTGCAPLCVEYTVSSSPVASSANWSLGDGSLANGVLTAGACYNVPGIYTITAVVADQNGCVGVATYTAEVYPKPIADFNHAPIKPIINIDGDVVFTDASHGANIASWNWYFMNNAQYTSNLQNPTFLYTEAGTYAVALVVKSDKGCTDTIVRPLIVGEDFGIYVPNAFTPNNDGLNELFQPKGFGITKYNLKIFDRWGERIFETSSFEEGWDGSYQNRGNKIIENGVYTWLIEVTSVFGKAHELKGHVTLIK